MNNGKSERHVLSILVDNEPGVLSRIVGLFSGRGFNITSLCVAETTEENVSRITIVTVGDMAILEQIKKQLNKLITVLKVWDYTGISFVHRDMALVRVRARPESRAEILRMADIFRSRVVDVGPEYYTLEVTGTEDKISAFLELISPLGIKEIARTGTIALAREKQNKEAVNGRN